jgi:hypothetical protein
MPNSTYTEPVTLLRGHLEEIYAALDTAYGFHSADDLARQYKNVGSTHRPSNLTKRLEKALAHTEGYLVAREDDDGVREE